MGDLPARGLNTFPERIEEAECAPAHRCLALTWAVLAVALGLCGVAFQRLVLPEGPGDAVAVVAFSAGLFFLATKVFHHNYVVWWLPVVGVTLARALSAPRRRLQGRERWPEQGGALPRANPQLRG